MYLESKPSDSSREISKSLYYECRVRGSFCERSEEYDVKSISLYYECRIRGSFCERSEEKTIML